MINNSPKPTKKLSDRAIAILKLNNYGWHPDLSIYFNGMDYKRAVKLWLIFQRDIKDFSYAENLEIDRKKLHKALSQQLNWYSRFKAHPQEFIHQIRINQKSRWRFVYKAIAPELEGLFASLREIEQLSLFEN